MWSALISCRDDRDVLFQWIPSAVLFRGIMFFAWEREPYSRRCCGTLLKPCRAPEHFRAGSWAAIIILAVIPLFRFGLYTFGNDARLLLPGERAMLDAHSPAIDPGESGQIGAISHYRNRHEFLRRLFGCVWPGRHPFDNAVEQTSNCSISCVISPGIHYPRGRRRVPGDQRSRGTTAVEPAER